MGVLAKRFFQPSPTRVAAEIEHGGVGFVGAAGARFAGGTVKRLLHQCRMPTRCHRQRHRKDRRVVRRMTMRALAANQSRNPQSRLFFQLTLQVVDLARTRLGVPRVKGVFDLADARRETVTHCFNDAREPLLCGRGISQTQRADLRNFLGQSHARHEIVYPELQ